ncbi:hypothetical protein Pan216_56980 [Planctomycetes bacterium Pan216]|uniref:Uncharacterized protein n=1 Tax=Kolteria novifilia TaxID=2527975 RepID=A0A518BCV2_9BACT|nr:hypothetical protein Pan216_56980 [Planctomycetes bacterium Pan216]
MPAPATRKATAPANSGTPQSSFATLTTRTPGWNLTRGSGPVSFFASKPFPTLPIGRWKKPFGTAVVDRDEVVLQAVPLKLKWSFEGFQ